MAEAQQCVAGDTRGNHLLYVRGGAAYSCGGSELYEDGEAFIGHLGHGDTWGEHVHTPQPMLFAVACQAVVVQVAAGNLHSLVLCADGHLFSCGGGWEGPLGLGSAAPEDRLKPVTSLAPSSWQKVVSVAAGAAHSLAITDRGAAFSWGWGRLGQLGHEEDSSEYLPRKIAALSHVHVRGVKAGPTHSVVTTGDGVARPFGTTPHGALHRLDADARCASSAELPYEPLARYRALAPQLRTPRGAKSVEHLRILRTSKPTYDTLTPSRTQPSAHELPYEPLARYRALAPQLRTPRGAKSVEHLEVLRTSDPCRARGKPPSVRQPALPPANCRTAPATTYAAAQAAVSEPSAAPSALTVSSMRRSVSLEELSQLTKLTHSVSVESWLCGCDETDELPELPSDGCSGLGPRMRWWRPAQEEDGFDYGSECASDRSAAITHERVSNQTEEEADVLSCASFEERSSVDQWAKPP